MRRISLREIGLQRQLSRLAALLVASTVGTVTIADAGPPTPLPSASTLAPSMSLDGYYLHQGGPDFVEYYNITSAIGSQNSVSGTHTEVVKLEEGAVVVFAHDVSGSIDFNSQTFKFRETNFRVVSTTVNIANIEGLGARDPDSWSGKLTSDGFTLSGTIKETGEPIQIQFRRATVDEVDSVLSSFGLPKIGA